MILVYVCYNFLIADIDECLIANICGNNATCTNTVGSFICECDVGYTETGFVDRGLNCTGLCEILCANTAISCVL